MAHEYSHNFLEGSDLYGGGGGKIGYWDLLGDSLAVGMMSDTSSYYKSRLGWITFKNVLNGPVMAAAEFRLQPYATTGEAIKIVPDPANNPKEYFLLEFRTATGGDSNWTPDGGLKESGLLIAHINDRFGDGATGYLCSSPFMDIEEADRNDGKCWDNRTYCDLQWSDPPNAQAGSVGVSVYPPNNWPDWKVRPPGVLYPFGNNTSFTPTSNPNSNFYGGRDSGLSITNIRKVGNEMIFTVEMTGNNQAVYQLGANDQYYFADFNGDGKDELLIFNGNTLALLEHEQNQFHMIWQAQTCLGGWHFGNGDRLYIGDFNGDGRADVFIRSAEWAGLFICDGQSFTEVWMTGDPAQNQNWIGGWHLGSADSEYIGDFDGDGKDDIFIRSPQWAALLLATGNGFNNVWMTGDPNQNQNWIDGWHLGPGDRHIVGDFNGDGRDDIFIRSDQWAAVLTSDGSRLHVEWMSGDPAQNSNWVDAWQLTSADRELSAHVNYSPNADVFVYRPGQQTGVFLMTEGGIPHVTWLAGSTFAAKSSGAPVDRFYRGRFTGGHNTDVLVFDGNQLVLYRNTGGSLQRIWRSGNWLGGWHLGFDDHLLIGDFNGDGRDDIFIRSPLWAGLLISTGAGFENVWMTGDPAQNQDWIGGWHLGIRDREVVGDFNGDGKADMYIRSDVWAGILLSQGDSFTSAFVQQNMIGPWQFNPADRELIGRFSGRANDEIFVYHPWGWTGALTPSAGNTSGQLNVALTAAQFRQITAR
jgi:hypothetical protein